MAKGLRISVVWLFLATVAGCSAPAMSLQSYSKQGIDPRRVMDPAAQSEAEQLCNWVEFYSMCEQLKATRKPEVMPPKKSVLVLSGGGTYGAYTAGVLVGWSEAGNRPNFDVVTGVSTGALIAAMVFLGPEMDGELKRLYTTVSNNDIYIQKLLPRGILSESLADNTPLEKMIMQVVTPDYLTKVAAEHRKGRRLYVGTTEMDSRQPIIWDMGAIACQGTAESRVLFSKLLLASAAIPGFFPPVRIPVEIDGRRSEELHVDGGVTQAVFARPPWMPANLRNGSHQLFGSDLYIITAGKLYADPQSIKLRALNIAATSVSTLIYSQTRDQLFKLYAVSVLTGMNYRLTSIPEEFPVPEDATTFDPITMSKMFDEGVRQIRIGQAWRDSPPGFEKGEEISVRAGVKLSTDQFNPQSVMQPAAKSAVIPKTENGIPIGPMKGN
ncbi:patatin-like phospholipase family protein [Telmatocola sphagniphila]|uniref:Patatin-like phospholipase family protein n=1 Tax=Telmatocola sphagniphila TaxID=1123043 RepID=A0A8E6B9T0_9BACT|nr:patatin-like phospholipase family protein [Telmatocola sphagniphila]QVL33005.1 patatin-like phospholipase family protein [Telmatocola sphagniphila]